MLRIKKQLLWWIICGIFLTGDSLFAADMTVSSPDGQIKTAVLGMSRACP
ncbi:MAG: hypothetical protein JW828_01720 [Sedimentisphaerales bacterium]|nr:hypothetical protein [Sedimentisphaerales bacterium]